MKMRAPACPPITEAAVKNGHQIFNGPGRCAGCHGENAKGTSMAPTLRAHKWRTINGSYSSIVQRTINGVSNPTPPYSETMPPRGGADLRTTQVCQVAAYVYSLSHPTGATTGKPAPTEAAAGPPESMTVTSGTSKLRITYQGTPDNYKIRVANPTGQSNVFSYSAEAAPPETPQTAAAGEEKGESPTKPPEGCPVPTTRLVFEGYTVYNASGNCYTCHAPDTRGTAMGPDLRTANLSYEDVFGHVHNGLPAGHEYPFPMPAKGGDSSLHFHQICAVAAYVGSISH